MFFHLQVLEINDNVLLYSVSKPKANKKFVFVKYYVLVICL